MFELLLFFLLILLAYLFWKVLKALHRYQSFLEGRGEFEEDVDLLQRFQDRQSREEEYLREKELRDQRRDPLKFF